MQNVKTAVRHARARAAVRKSLVEFTAAHCPSPGEPAQQAIHVVQVDKKTGAIHIIHVVAQRANIARPICAVLLGENHPAKYRMATGVGVMVFGVAIAKVFGHMVEPIGYAADLIGYAIHGLGLTPFIEHLAKRIKDSKA